MTNNLAVCPICLTGTREMECQVIGDYICDSCCQKFQLNKWKDGWKKYFSKNPNQVPDMKDTYQSIEKCLSCPNMCRFDDKVIGSDVFADTAKHSSERKSLFYFPETEKKFYYVFSNSEEKAFIKFEKMLTDLDVGEEEKVVQLARVLIFDNEQYEEGIELLNSIDGKSLKYFAYKGEAFRHLNKEKEAIECFIEAVRLDPSGKRISQYIDIVSIKSFIGQAYFYHANQMHDESEREKALFQALSLLEEDDNSQLERLSIDGIYLYDPTKFGNAYSNDITLAKLYFELGDYTKTILNLRQYLKMFPQQNDVELKRDLKGKIKGLKQVQSEDAIAYFKKVTTQVHQLLAQCYALKQIHHKAMEHAEIALNFSTKDATFFNFYEQLLEEPSVSKAEMKEWIKHSLEELGNTIRNESSGIKESIRIEANKLHLSIADQKRLNEQLLEEVKGILDEHSLNMEEVVGLTLNEVKDMRQELKDYSAFLQRLNQVRNEDSMDDEKVIMKLTETFKGEMQQYLGSFSFKKDQIEKKLSNEFGDLWETMLEETKSYLITSEVIYQSFQFFEGLDFSPAVIPLTKAIELELYHKMYQPLIEYCKQKYPTPPTRDYIENNLPVGIYYYNNFKNRYQFERLITIGTFCKVVGTNKNNNQQSLKLFKAANIVKKGTLDNAPVLEAFSSTLNTIKDLRNEVCHKDGVKISDAAKLRDLIVWERKFLKDFLSYVNQS